MANMITSDSVFKHRSVIVSLGLPLLGLLLIVLAQTFHETWWKIEWDHTIAEVGALLFVVSFLHWLFELGLRAEMLREVASTVAGSTVLRDCGMDSCSINSRKVEERVHWTHCPRLIVGRQYSTRFLKDFHEILQIRAQMGLETIVMVLSPQGNAAKYLETEGSGTEGVKASLEETLRIIEGLNGDAKKQIDLRFYDRILRYSFIYTNESVWIIFYTNKSGRASVPAFKVTAGSPLYKFFEDDIQGLLEQSK